LNHTLSICILHGLLSISFVSIRIIRFSLAVCPVLSLSRRASAWAVLVAAQLVLLLEGNTVGSV
jgi:hypothetical protein